MIIDMNIDEFLRQTASGSPTPGGGSTCALVGALGAALSSMVGEISLRNEKDDKIKFDMNERLSICSNLNNKLKESIEEDVIAFNCVMTAIKMPKTNDEEKNKRSSALQKSLKDAANPPYNTAKLCLDVMNMSVDMLNLGNKNALSDASVSGYLGYAALNGALYNVIINLNSIKDESYVKDMRLKVEGLRLESEVLLKKIKTISTDKIG